MKRAIVLIVALMLAQPAYAGHGDGPIIDKTPPACSWDPDPYHCNPKGQ